MDLLIRVAPLALLVVVGCPESAAFVCSDPAQCDLLDGPAVCLGDGECGYTDETCESGVRRSPNARQRPGACEPHESGSTEPDASTSSGGDPPLMLPCENDPRVTSGHLQCVDHPGLLAWYRLDDAPGSVAVEDANSDGTFDGAVRGSPVFGEPGAFGGAVRFAHENPAILDGIDLPSSLLSALAPEGIPPRRGTLEAWVSLEPQDADCQDDCDRFVVHISDEEGDGFGDPGPDLHVFSGLEAGVGYTWKALIGSPVDGGGCLLEADTPVAFDTWTHLALRWDESSCALYVNGLAAAHSSLGEPAGPWTHGRLGHPPRRGDRRFEGALDEIMLFDHARSEAQLRGDCGAPPCPTP